MKNEEMTYQVKIVNLEEINQTIKQANESAEFLIKRGLILKEEISPERLAARLGKFVSGMIRIEVVDS